MVKILPPMQETWVRSLGWGDVLEKEMAIPPVFLPGKSHGQSSLASYSLWGPKRVGHLLETKQQQPYKNRKYGDFPGSPVVKILCF